VAEGWNLDDFGSPWPRGRLPVDMDPSEAIVGQPDRVRARRAELFVLWTALPEGETLELSFDFASGHT